MIEKRLQAAMIVVIVAACSSDLKLRMALQVAKREVKVVGRVAAAVEINSVCEVFVTRLAEV